MLAFEVMPSMRLVWAAGEAAKTDNTAIYNCAFQNIDSVEAFSECLYILMCGTGYGFSVTEDSIEKLPVVPILGPQGAGTCVVGDSKLGWSESVKMLVEALYQGKDLAMDYSGVRKQGARLKTMGGRASGPEPLMRLHEFIRTTFSQAQGRKLTTLECHDICNQIAEIVVVGGVRRSSEISLSDLDDYLMATAKVPPFPVRRYMANNSAVYKEKPTAAKFLREWSTLANSGTGERGIFNLHGARITAPKRRDSELIDGTNPCGEIMLRSKEFCNLSEVVIRSEYDVEDLLDRVETATWLGIIQSTFTHFPNLSPEWKKNCEEERLLGVSLTGQMDNPELLSDAVLKAAKSKAIKVARRASKHMEIPMPAAITCVKPSGTVSQLVDSASGLHARYSLYYIRRYRISASDPLFKMMKAQGVHFHAEVGQRRKDWNKAKKAEEAGESTDMCSIYDGTEYSIDKVNTWVVEFPVESPKNSVFRKDVTAITQLEWYKKIQQNWCEHNASCTVYVKDEEWFEVGNWVYDNWDIINGVSFLPYDGGKYELAPYEEIDKKTYKELLAKQVEVDYTQLSKYETEDGTSGAKSYACVGDRCELK
jgi:ribonucleoside-diphosphate reductase alpha chain